MRKLSSESLVALPKRLEMSHLIDIGTIVAAPNSVVVINAIDNRFGGDVNFFIF